MNTQSAENGTSYPLSENQKGLWVLQKTNPGMSAYNCPALLEVNSKIDQDKLRKAGALFMQKHPIFKSQFHVEDDMPRQRIPANVEPEALFYDVSGVSNFDLMSTIEASTRIPFELENGPLLRFTLFTSSVHQHWLLLETHHLVCDGNSFHRILNDFFTIYISLLRGDAIDCSPPASTYAEFVELESEFMQSSAAEKTLGYWQKTLDGVTQAVGLTPDKSKPATLTYAGSTHLCSLVDEDYEDVRDFAGNVKVTIPMVFLGAFKLLLKDNLSQNDIVVGLPTAGRDKCSKNQIGYFANMVPIRSHIDPDMKRTQFLKGLQSTVLGGVMKPYPFSALVKDLGIVSSNSGYPVFAHSYVFQGYEAYGATESLFESFKPELDISLVKKVQQKGEFEFELEIAQRENSFDLTFKYNPDLFTESTIARMADQYLLILQKLLEPDDLPIRDYHCLAQQDIEKLQLWNSTDTAYSDVHVLGKIIEEQVLRTPDKIAVKIVDQTLTYKELWDLSGSCAAQMQFFDVKKGDIVAICMSRSLELSIGLLAILRVGGSYVPLDAELPAERLEFIAKDCGAQMVLCQEETNQLISGVVPLTVSRASLDIWLSDEKLNFKTPVISPEDRAYIIYTSGSTGLPKGCAVSHRAICNRILWMHDEFPITEDDVVLQKTPYSFDVSVWELFWPLMVGSQIEYAVPGGHREPQYLTELIAKAGVTVCHFVPSMLGVFVESYRKTHKLPMKYIFTSGEALTYAQLKSAKSVSTACVANLYGPTEAAVDVSYWRSEDRQDKKVPIGKPIANTKLHVLNDQFQQCPIGVPGVLYISGTCLADGYVNRNELTAEKFIDSPALGFRVYDTGDIARWLPDGNIEYLGRNDHQVKVRGFRIELGEIEQKLSWHPDVTSAVVSVLKIGSDSSLVAYYTKTEFSHLSEQEVRNYLSLKLPEYMVPAYIVEMESIPTSYSGKADRSKLPDPRTLISNDELCKPESEIEEKLMELWQRELDLKNIGTAQNFFQIGGNSLSSLMMLLKVEDAFAPRSVSQENFYKNPTIQGLASLLENTDVVSVDSSLLRPLTSAPSLVDPSMTVICCPYAGASITAFAPFAEELVKVRHDWNVLGFRVPGNEVGDVSQSESIVNLASIAVEEVVASVQGPVVLYGHCVGSSLAIELAYQLEQRGVEVVGMVAGGAFPFPKIFTRLPMSDPWQMVSNVQVSKLMKKWGGPSDDIEPRILSFMLKNFRKDAKSAFLYQKRFMQSRKLSCPIVAIVSKDDPLTKRFGASLQRWKNHSDTVRLIAMKDGKHYFVTTRPRQLAEIFSNIFENLENVVPSDMEIAYWNASQPGNNKQGGLVYETV